MTHTRVLGSATAVGLCLIVPALPASAQLAARPLPQLVSRQAAAAASTELTGTVSDRGGRPLAGAVVSAIGSESAFAVSDRDGRFTFRTLPQGPYVVRAHLQGYLPTRPRLVQISTSARGDFTITLVRRSEAADAPAVIAAGVGPVDVSSPEPDPGETHEHDELAWRLRHLKRSVLKDQGESIPGVTDLDADSPWTGGLSRAMGESARLATSILDLPLAGQFNLLTTTSFDRPQELFSTDGVLPRSIAFLSLSAPMPSGEWRMRGAITQGDLSSWTVAGSFAREATAAHAYQAGFSYGMQRYAGGNAEALAAMRDGSRTVGMLYAYDNWTLARAVSVDFGGRYSNYGYLQDRGLLSPRAGVTVRPTEKDSLTLRASVSHRESAPGAEEFIPPAIGVWLPPERTFSPVSRRGSFRPERIDHVEVGAERQMPGHVLVGVRAFRQRGADQIVTLFGLSAAGAEDNTGHYHVGTAGDFDAVGWGVSATRTVGESTRASVEYSLADADWTGRSRDIWALAGVASQVLRRSDRVHDLTASLESVVPASSTRVFVLYKINSAVADDGIEQVSAGGPRFDVQINQALPFSFARSRWEALVAVRNVFHDEFDSGSIYDELLVVRAPTRVLGGVTVKF